MMLAVDLPGLESIMLEAPFHSWAWADTLSLGSLMIYWRQLDFGHWQRLWVPSLALPTELCSCPLAGCPLLPGCSLSKKKKKKKTTLKRSRDALGTNPPSSGTTRSAAR